MRALRTMTENDGSLPHVPREVVVRVFERLPILTFLGGAVATCRQFSLKWYLGRSFQKVVVVPDEEQSINAAMNRLAREGYIAHGHGLVLVRPGLYQETVRVTQNCHVLGYGPCQEIVVEAPGWESALVSAGLGGYHMPKMLGWAGFTSGEAACIENITFRCRNEQMRGQCVYIVMGQLHLVRCTVDGGVVVSGARTAPRFSECRIRKSRGNGMRFTDHSHALMNRSYVEHHGGHGVLIERNSKPKIAESSICGNAGYGIRVYCGSNMLPSSASPVPASLESIRNNYFDGNEVGELSLTPRDLDSDNEESPCLERFFSPGP